MYRYDVARRRAQRQHEAAARMYEDSATLWDAREPKRASRLRDLARSEREAAELARLSRRRRVAPSGGTPAMGRGEYSGDRWAARRCSAENARERAAKALEDAAAFWEGLDVDKASYARGVARRERELARQERLRGLAESSSRPRR
jgi:hypothetical protein